MSLAKVHEVKHVRKPGECEKCGKKIEKGDPAVRFAVGFRGFTRTRCTAPSCFPKPSERESSLVSSVYAAQEDADLSTCTSLKDLESVRDDVVNAANEVADEYEANEMFERNEDLQERADMCRSAADELEGWEPENEEPDAEEDPDLHEDWLDAARESLQEAIDGMELP